MFWETEMQNCYVNDIKIYHKNSLKMRKYRVFEYGWLLQLGAHILKCMYFSLKHFSEVKLG